MDVHQSLVSSVQPAMNLQPLESNSLSHHLSIHSWKECLFDKLMELWVKENGITQHHIEWVEKLFQRGGDLLRKERLDAHGLVCLWVVGKQPHVLSKLWPLLTSWRKLKPQNLFVDMLVGLVVRTLMEDACYMKNTINMNFTLYINALAYFSLDNFILCYWKHWGWSLCYTQILEQYLIFVHSVQVLLTELSSWGINFSLFWTSVPYNCQPKIEELLAKAWEKNLQWLRETRL